MSTKKKLLLERQIYLRIIKSSYQFESICLTLKNGEEHKYCKINVNTEKGSLCCLKVTRILSLCLLKMIKSKKFPSISFRYVLGIQLFIKFLSVVVPFEDMKFESMATFSFCKFNIFKEEFFTNALLPKGFLYINFF